MRLFTEHVIRRTYMDKIKLGFVPTRRSIFSAPDAIKYRGRRLIACARLASTS